MKFTKNNFENKIIGKKAKKDIPVDSVVWWDDVELF